MAVITITKANFDNEVKNSDKPVLLDFWAEWCGPCRMISPTVHEIADEAVDFKVGQVNVDDQPELARAFGIMNIPTLVVVKDGKVINKSAGVKPKDAILSMINEAI